MSRLGKAAFFGLICLFFGGLVGLSLVMSFAPGLAQQIGEARAYAHATVCPGNQATAPPSCIAAMSGTVTDRYRVTGSRGGTTYYVTVHLTDGTSHGPVSIGSAFYSTVAVGDDVEADMWGSHMAAVRNDLSQSLTDDTPTAVAGGAALATWGGAVLLVSAIVWSGLVVRRVQRRAVPVDWSAGRLTFRPSPTRASFLGRMGWAIALAVGALLGAAILDNAWLLGLPLLAVGVGVWTASRQCRPEITLTTEGLFYRKVSTAQPQFAPWAQVHGIRTFGAGRTRYRAIALASGQRIRSDPFFGFTATSEALRVAVTAHANHAAGMYGTAPPLVYAPPGARGVPAMTPPPPPPTARPPGWPPA